MIKFERTSVVGWEPAIRGMRNPKNSWDKSDTVMSLVGDSTDKRFKIVPEIGPNDLRLMQQLVQAGTDHRKFMRMITVYVDITAPLYWWKEFDTYKVGTVANSCSTMHKITGKEFRLEDFSTEHLSPMALNTLNDTIYTLNVFRDLYIKAVPLLTETPEEFASRKKGYWWQLIQLLPSSYNQLRTVELNYEVLSNMYKATSRRHHKLDEWNVDCPGSLCDWIKSLPYSELITGTE